MKYRYSLECDESGVISVKPDAEYPEPWGNSMLSEIQAAIASAIQGDFIGGWERTEDGGWIKPLGSTHENGGVIGYGERGRRERTLYEAITDEAADREVDALRLVCDRLAKLETACAGIVRDHEFRQAIRPNFRGPNGDS